MKRSVYLMESAVIAALQDVPAQFSEWQAPQSSWRRALRQRKVARSSCSAGRARSAARHSFWNLRRRR